MRDSRHLRTFVIGGVVTALIGLVALGGSAGASSPGKAPAKKATGEPIKLQIQGSFTGGGLDFTDIPDAAKAAAEAINKGSAASTAGRSRSSCATPGSTPTRVPSAPARRSTRR